MMKSTHQLFDLTGKKAILCGSLTGLGYGCAEALYEAGASLVLIERKAEKLQQAKQELMQSVAGASTAGQTIEMVRLDFSDWGAVSDCFQQHADSGIFFNCIGANRPKSFLEVDEDDYDTVMDTNVKIAFFQTQHYIKTRLKQTDPASSIIHLSSQMGLVGGFERSIYCASKHAMEGMVKAVSLEIGQWNMRINTICPTFIATPLTEATLEDEAKVAHIMRYIQLPRIGKIEDIKGVALYLASDASNLVTGSAFKLDGGWTAH